MHPMLVILHLAGAVFLLLWAVRMVRTGVERALGARLKEALRKVRGKNYRAAAVGTLLAVMLQSSTAVGVLAAGFATAGVMAVSTGIAALLGADLGSALVVKILTFDLSLLVPVLLIAGVSLFLKSGERAVRQLGRILVGIALILMSLRMIGEATEPLRDNPLLPQVAGYLAGDPLTSFTVAAVVAWFVHSSVAAVLLIVTFAARGALPLEAALPMVLGANLGGGAISVSLTRGMDAAARQIPFANLLFRGIAAIGVLAALFVTELPVQRLGTAETAQLVNFHLLFNGLVALVCVPFATPMERLVAWLMPGAPTSIIIESEPVSALDRGALSVPKLALASATRELLRIGDIVEKMLRPVVDLFHKASSADRDRIREMDRQVNRAQRDVKFYITELNRGEMSAGESRRALHLVDFAVNLEHIGDIIAKTLIPLAEEKVSRRIRFSDEGWSEIIALHARVVSNMELAFNVLISEDLESSRLLVREKEEMRRMERESHDRHLRRLGSGNRESIETSEIHLEVVRAFKEINSLLATVAYPILQDSGALLESRLAGPANGNGG